LLAVASSAAAHDESVGARFVQPGGVDAGNCLDHHAPCVSMQYALAQAEPGNTVKVGAGIFDLSGVNLESFLHGPVHATGGYGNADHYYESRPLEVQSIVVGVGAQYRNALAVRGFYWAASKAAAERNEISFAGRARCRGVPQFHRLVEGSGVAATRVLSVSGFGWLTAHDLPA